VRAHTHTHRMCTWDGNTAHQLTDTGMKTKSSWAGYMFKVMPLGFPNLSTQSDTCTVCKIASQVEKQSLCCGFTRQSLWLLCKEDFARKGTPWHAVLTKWSAFTFPPYSEGLPRLPVPREMDWQGWAPHLAVSFTQHSSPWFLLGWCYIMDAVSVPPLATTLMELYEWIKVVVTSIKPDLPSKVWTELVYRYICCTKKDTLIENL
jgi:hypothetical protein